MQWLGFKMHCLHIKRHNNFGKHSKLLMLVLCQSELVGAYHLPEETGFDDH